MDMAEENARRARCYKEEWQLEVCRGCFSRTCHCSAPNYLLSNSDTVQSHEMIFKVLAIAAAAGAGVNAARPFLNEPDTGITDVLGDLAVGALPDIADIVGLPDFDFAARNYLPAKN